MYIGVLNHPDSGLDITCSYRHRGADTPLEPDVFENLPSAGRDDTSESGKANRMLAGGYLPDGGKLGWHWQSLMDVGVDLVFAFSASCYLGAVCLTLAEGALVQSVEILTDTEEGLRICGRHDARSGASCGGSIQINAGVTANRFIIRLRPLLTDVILTRMALIGAVLAEEPLIYPTPEQQKFSGGALDLQRLAMLVKQDDNAATDFAATHLQELLVEQMGMRLPVGSLNEPLPGNQATLALGLDQAAPPASYVVDVTEKGVLLQGADRLSLLYACETFVQMARNGAIPLGRVFDQPYKPLRGFHIGLPPRESFGFFRSLLRYVLLPLRYNTLFIEFAGGMRFQRHPEISDAWQQANQAAKKGEIPPFPHGEMVAGGELLEQEEVRELVDYAKSFGFAVIPEVQSLSHVQYITYAHPEIAEIAESEHREKREDTRAADQPPSAFYAHSYCPSHEQSYMIICDIIDEIVDVVRPEQYVHMGHDEIYQMAICPRCAGQDPADLYVRHVKRLYEYLRQKGLGMMIWSDMLHATERYLTHPAVTRLPRDIVMLDFIWYFHTDLDMEDHLLPHGYEVVMGNLYSSHYPRYVARAAKPNMTGGEVSTWCRLDEYNLAKKGKIFDLMYCAEMLWSARYREEARLVYTEIIQSRLPALRDALRGFAGLKKADKTFWPMTIPQAARSGLPGALRLWLEDAAEPPRSGIGEALYPIDAFALDSARRLSDEPLNIPVNNCYDRLVFLHATADNAARVAWASLNQVGVYVVRYADGSTLDIPVEYAGNIWYWNKRYAAPMLHPYYRHQGYMATYMADPVVQGKTETGADLLLLGYEWVNPYPDRQLAGISCRGFQSAGADILLMGVSGVQINLPGRAGIERTEPAKKFGGSENDAISPY